MQNTKEQEKKAARERGTEVKRDGKGEVEQDGRRPSGSSDSETPDADSGRGSYQGLSKGSGLCAATRGNHRLA